MRTELDVLQHLAMEGIAETEDIVASLEHPKSAIVDTLESLEADGYVENEGFWYLTEAGETRLGEVCRERFTDEQVTELAAWFEEFEAYDRRMKEAAESWQDLSEPDRGPDADPVGELRALHASVESLFEELSAEIRAEYDSYLDGLATAVDELERGQVEYFTGTDVDSYHTVWFELHDDLLRTLGEERA